MNQINKFLLAAVFGTMPAIAGCSAMRGTAAQPEGAYFLNPNKSAGMLGRVTFVELENLSSIPQVSDDMTDALAEVMQKKHLFGLVVLKRDDPACKGLALFERTSYSLEEIDLIRKSLKTDAVLVGSVTQYHSYPRLTIGLRLKLIDLRDGELVWALEQLWDSTDKQVEKRIEAFFKTQIRSGYDPLEYRMAMVSPRMFQKFVAYEVGQTLRDNPRNAGH